MANDDRLSNPSRQCLDGSSGVHVLGGASKKWIGFTGAVVTGVGSPRQSSCLLSLCDAFCAGPCYDAVKWPHQRQHCSFNTAPNTSLFTTTSTCMLCCESYPELQAASSTAPLLCLYFFLGAEDNHRGHSEARQLASQQRKPLLLKISACVHTRDDETLSLLVGVISPGEFKNCELEDSVQL